MKKEDREKFCERFLEIAKEKGTLEEEKDIYHQVLVNSHHYNELYDIKNGIKSENQVKQHPIFMLRKGIRETWIRMRMIVKEIEKRQIK